MTNPDTPPALDLDALAALEQAATPGPWEPGHIWLTAGLMYDDDYNRVNEGATKCTYCHLGEPVESKRENINGRWMPAHRHRSVEAYEPQHLLSGADGSVVVGNYDYERGGILRAEDLALIAAARNALPALLSALAAARAERDEARRDVWRLESSDDFARAVAEEASARWEKRYEEALAQRDRAIQEHATAQAELAAAREQAKQAQAEAAVWWAGWEDGEWEGDGLYTDVEHAKAMSLACYLDAEVLPLDEHADGEDEDEAEVRKRREEVAVNLSWQAAGDNYCWRLNDTKHGWTGVALYRWKVDTRTCAEPVPAGGEDGSGTADGEVAPC